MTLDSQGKEAREPAQSEEISGSGLGILGAADVAARLREFLRSEASPFSSATGLIREAVDALAELAALLRTQPTPAKHMVVRIVAACGRGPLRLSEEEAVKWLAVALLEEICEAHALWGDRHGAGALVAELRADEPASTSAGLSADDLLTCGRLPAGINGQYVGPGRTEHINLSPPRGAQVEPQLRTRIELEAKLAELEAEHATFSHEDPIVSRAMNAMFTNRIAGLEYALGRDSLPPTAALSGDPPGLRLVWEVDDRHFAPAGPGEWHVELESTRGPVRSMFFRKCATRQAGEAEARAAAWSWHARRRALAERLRGGEGLCEEVWPGCLGWSDAEVVEVERWLTTPTARRPMVLGHSSQFALLRHIADGIGVRARHAILTAHERFEAGEEEVMWNFGELFGACRMHPEGDKANRADVRTTGREYASNMAAAHINGAILGMLALVRHAEQEIGE